MAPDSPRWPQLAPNCPIWLQMALIAPTWPQLVPDGPYIAVTKVFINLNVNLVRWLSNMFKTTDLSSLLNGFIRNILPSKPGGLITTRIYPQYSTIKTRRINYDPVLELYYYKSIRGRSARPIREENLCRNLWGHGGPNLQGQILINLSSRLCMQGGMGAPCCAAFVSGMRRMLFELDMLSGWRQPTTPAQTIMSLRRVPCKPTPLLGVSRRFFRASKHRPGRRKALQQKRPTLMHNCAMLLQYGYGYNMEHVFNTCRPFGGARRVPPSWCHQKRVVTSLFLLLIFSPTT